MKTHSDPVAGFRVELVSWLAEHLTPAVIEAGQAGMDVGDNFEILRTWNQTLADAGWAAVAWPREFGGREAGIAEQLAFFEEMSAKGVTFSMPPTKQDFGGTLARFVDSEGGHVSVSGS